MFILVCMCASIRVYVCLCMYASSCDALRGARRALDKSLEWVVTGQSLRLFHAGKGMFSVNGKDCPVNRQDDPTTATLF